MKLLKVINASLDTEFSIDTVWKNADFRNCCAHYGLGQVLKESELLAQDPMVGLTYKIFQCDYTKTRTAILEELKNLAVQLENCIL